MDALQIYSDKVTPRLNYACRILFDCILNIPYHIYRYGQKAAQEGPAIYYTTQQPPGEKGVHITPSGLLESADIVPLQPVVAFHHNIPLVYFSGPATPEGFDPFAAAFFMASRYEEYLPFEADAFGRFPESGSLSGKNGFTGIPVVHAWAGRLKNALQQEYPGFKVPAKKAGALFTYDIDVAYAYRGRSFTVHALSFANDLLAGRFSGMARKIKSVFGLKSDPSDTYNLLENNPLPTMLFFLVASKRTTYDRNISPRHKALKNLVARFCGSAFPVGIHPSYYSSEKPSLVAQEKKVLEQMAGKIITASRQHFLRFRLPETFRALEAAGIRNDYSMQYPEMPGFRAGICVPFPFFDLAGNRETALTLHPGCIMETTFRDDLKIPAAQSTEWYLRLWNEVEKAGGQFISIWHNDTLWEGLPDHHPLAFRQVHNLLVEKITAFSGRNA